MSKLAHPKDVVCDDMGVWKWKESYRMWLSVDEIGWKYWARHFPKPHPFLVTASGNVTIRTNPAGTSVG